MTKMYDKKISAVSSELEADKNISRAFKIGRKRNIRFRHHNTYNLVSMFK
jgi:hypothetical protein